MSADGLPEETVEVLVFRVGEIRYGADASQVSRIAKASHGSRLSDALGMPSEGTRALVFAAPAAGGSDGAAPDEAELCVDAVDGVRAAPIDELRRLPPAAGHVRAVLGLWLPSGQPPIVLVDLPRTIDLPGGSA